MGLLPHPEKSPKRKSKKSLIIEDFASRSTVHGVSYIFDKTIALFDRLLWTFICLASATFAIYLIHTSYSDWQDNQVITTLKSVAQPVTDHDFPAFTICGAGQHMGNVEKILYHNFKQWKQKQAVKDQHKSIEDSFAEYLKETFQIHEKGTNILDILNTMISPSHEVDGVNAVRRNEVACAKRNKRRKRATEEELASYRKKVEESTSKTTLSIYK